MSQFLDQAFIQVRSGDGGNGMIAWRREKYEPMGGPAGGNGGKGGSVYFEATRDLNTLVDFRFKKIFEADNGMKGRSKNQHGKGAPDLVIRVPVGTVIKDSESDQVIADLVRDEQRVLVAEGGRGGRGNTMLATQRQNAPHYCEPGERGIERKLELELKLIADIGIIGLPNAGKSTLLSVITKAKPKIADYPFSTLEPQLGVVVTGIDSAFVAADIPGLIEGASAGVGLGHDFLRHIERTRLLVHMVDCAQDDPVKAVATINKELEMHEAGLEDLPQYLVLNKADLADEEILEDIKEQLVKAGLAENSSEIFSLSAAASIGLKPLLSAVEEKLAQLKKAAKEAESEITYYDPKATERVDHGYIVTRKKNIFYVDGDRVERIVGVTDMRDPDSLHHMFNVMRSMGIIDELIAQGAVMGSEIVVGPNTFSFGPDL